MTVDPVRPRGVPLALLCILPLLLAAALYTSGVRLPFFSDDIATQRYVTRTSLPDLWTQVEVNGTYYRPLSNLLHKTIPLSAPLWHSVMLWLHLLNTVLTGALASQLGLQRRGVLMAMLLYAVFPFHAQAVLWAASIVHVLVTLLVLLAAMAALRSLTVRRWTGVALLAGMAAPFAHEAGVVAVLLVGVTLWARLGTRGLWPARRHILTLLLPLLLAAIAYWLLRAHFVGGTGFAFDPQRLWHNGAFFAQGFSLPAQLIAALLPGDAVLRAWLAFVVWLAILSPWLWRVRRLTLAMGLWAVMGLAPATLLLHPNYVIYGERLMTLAVPTVAIMAGALAVLHRRWWLWGVPLIVACMWLARDTVGLHQLHADAYRPLFEELRAVPGDTRLLFLNLPSQTEFAVAPLPLWRPNAGLLTDWIYLEDFLWLNLNQREWTQVVYAHVPELDPVLADLPTNFYGGNVPVADLPRLLMAQDRVYQAFALHGRWLILPAMQRLPAFSAGFLFSAGVRLAAPQATRYDDYVTVTLDWQLENAALATQTVYVHVLCDGALIAQADGDPFSNTTPFSAWASGDRWRETRVIVLPPATSPACVQVEIGLYERDTGARIPYTAGSTRSDQGIPATLHQGD